MTARTIKLDSLRRDLQVRAAIDAETVTRYTELMTEGTVFPPVSVFADADGVFWLTDGFHRVEAATALGRDTIAADVREGDRGAALWSAMGANARRGLRLSAVDVRHAVRLALQAWPDKSQREIAQQVGCSQATIQRVRQDVIQQNHVSLPATRTDSIGRQQPTVRPKSPAPAPAPATPKPAAQPAELAPTQPAAEPAPAESADDAMLPTPAEWAATLEELERLRRIVESDERLTESLAVIAGLRAEVQRLEADNRQLLADRNDAVALAKRQRHAMKAAAA